MTGHEALLAVGWLATALSLSSGLPQVVKLIRTRDRHGVSGWTYTIWVSTALFWAGWGFHIGSVPMMAVNLLLIPVLVAAVFLLDPDRGQTVFLLASPPVLVISLLVYAPLAAVIATILACLLAVPSVVEAYRTEDPSGVALGTWSLLVVACLVWIVYNVGIGYPLAATSLVVQAALSCVVIGRTVFDRRRLTGQAGAMSDRTAGRNVVVLAPMPLEMDAITTVFGLAPTSDAEGAPWTGQVGGSTVTAFHIGMGPAVTRSATTRLFDPTVPDHRPVHHVMIAGICGGLDPSIEVGAMINPEFVVDSLTGASFPNRTPGDSPRVGKLLTVEDVTFDLELNQRRLEDGFLAVDMETSAVAEVCEAQGCAWSAYRCVGDRQVDGLLDERIFALANPDGSGRPGELERLLAAEPELAVNLGRLADDATMAARRAAEAALRGCEALDR